MFKKILRNTLIFTLLLLSSLGLVVQSSEESKSSTKPHRSTKKRIKETEEINSDHKTNELTIEKVIHDYLDAHDINSDNLSISIKTIDGQTQFNHNEQMSFRSGSLYKLPLAMLFYEKINRNELALNQLLTLQDHQFEAPGPIFDQHQPGDQVTLKSLLENLIVYSDNTAGHVLYQFYGGWTQYRDDATKYTTHDLPQHYTEPQSYLTTQYMNDVLQYLYAHQTEYQTLINHLSIAQPYDYLNSKTPHLTIQKYGLYGDFIGASGLVLSDRPYIISIFTNDGFSMNRHLGELNKIVHNYLQGQ